MFSMMWEFQFWTIVLMPFLAVYLPIYAITVSDEATALAVEANSGGVWTWDRWFKVLVDITTIYIWYWAIPSGDWKTNFDAYKASLIYDGNLGTLTWIAWLLLPVNAMFFGSWTLILFPVTACVLLMNWFVWNQTILDYMNLGSMMGVMMTFLFLLMAAFGMS